jgi:hypothetical protein
MAESAAPILIANNQAILQILTVICQPKGECTFKTKLNRLVINCCSKLLTKIAKHSVFQVRELLFSLLEGFTQALINQ